MRMCVWQAIPGYGVYSMILAPFFGWVLDGQDSAPEEVRTGYTEVGVHGGGGTQGIHDPGLHSRHAVTRGAMGLDGAAPPIPWALGS